VQSNPEFAVLANLEEQNKKMRENIFDLQSQIAEMQHMREGDIKHPIYQGIGSQGYLLIGFACLTVMFVLIRLGMKMNGGLSAVAASPSQSRVAAPQMFMAEDAAALVTTTTPFALGSSLCVGQHPLRPTLLRPRVRSPSCVVDVEDMLFRDPEKTIPDPEKAERFDVFTWPLEEFTEDFSASIGRVEMLRWYIKTGSATVKGDLPDDKTTQRVSAGDLVMLHDGKVEWSELSDDLTMHVAPLLPIWNVLDKDREPLDREPVTGGTIAAPSN